MMSSVTKCCASICLSLVSTLAFANDQAVRVHRSVSESQVRTVQSLMPPALGHTYVSHHTWTTTLPMNCRKAIDELNDLFVKDMPQDQSIWDYVMACVPQGPNQVWLSFQILIEPMSDETISVVEEYIQKHQDIVWSKLTFHFETMSSFEIQKTVESKHLPNPNNWQKWDYRGELNGTFSTTFPSFAAYKQHLTEERLAFRSNKIEDLYDFLARIFGTLPAEKFKVNSLSRSNIVTSNNPMALRLTTGKLVQSNWSDGHFRECYKFDGGMCATP